jgi:hypothetical protein
VVEDFVQEALVIQAILLEVYPESFYFSFHEEIFQNFQICWKNANPFLRFFCMLLTKENIVNFIINSSSSCLKLLIEGFNLPYEGNIEI